VQSRLRSEIRRALPQAASENHVPTYTELAKAHIPYLDAFVEETLRHANTIAFVVRTAMQDTTMLERHIPKGTDVFLMANGAGYLEPNIPVSDASRSPGARASQGKSLTGLWDDADISQFKARAIDYYECQRERRERRGVRSHGRANASVRAGA